MSSDVNTLAAYFLNEDSDSLERNLDLPEHVHADDEILFYRNVATKVLGWFEDYRYACLFRFYNKEPTEPEMTAFIYDITKNNFGEDGAAVRNGFRRLYQLLFKSDKGPRLPIFIMLLGPQVFLNLLDTRIKNPFDFPEKVLSSQGLYEFTVQ